MHYYIDVYQEWKVSGLDGSVLISILVQYTDPRYAMTGSLINVALLLDSMGFMVFEDLFLVIV